MDTGWTGIRWVLAAVMLVAASVLDLRTRRVPNPFWGPWLWVAAALWVVDADGGDWAALGWGLLTAVATCLFFYLLWRTRVLFGGADAKALMVLAVLVPWNIMDGAARVTPAADALVNGLLLTMTVPVLLLVTNLARGRFAGAATFLAYPLAIQDARERFVAPLEYVDDEGRVRRRLVGRLDEDLSVRYDVLEAAGVTHVWATPRLALLVPVTAGLLVAAFWGDLVLAGVHRLLS